MRKVNKELVSIRSFLQQMEEAGELEPGAKQDVERSLIELDRAVRDGDHHMVMVAVGDIARKIRK
jgi:hypothetical protein